MCLFALYKVLRRRRAVAKKRGSALIFCWLPHLICNLIHLRTFYTKITLNLIPQMCLTWSTLPSFLKGIGPVNLETCLSKAKYLKLKWLCLRTHRELLCPCSLCAVATPPWPPGPRRTQRQGSPPGQAPRCCVWDVSHSFDTCDSLALFVSDGKDGYLDANPAYHCPKSNCWGVI